jgi:hypothetical protein
MSAFGQQAILQGFHHFTVHVINRHSNLLFFLNSKADVGGAGERVGIWICTDLCERRMNLYKSNFPTLSIMA